VAALAGLILGLAAAAGAAGSEAALAISARGAATMRLTVVELAKLPSRTVAVKEVNGRNSIYRGTPLIEILRIAKIPLGRELRGEWLSRYLMVRAADGYEAVFALPELDPEWNDGTMLLCYSKDGEPISPQEGPLRLVIPSEKHRGRWVRQVSELRLMH
jgi:DMSO/TMAO reductase YedYZ molybdopterin-dependent catalytic subunit